MVSSVDIVKCAGVGCLTYAVMYKRPLIVNIFSTLMIHSMYNIMYAISYLQIKLTNIINSIKTNEKVSGFLEFFEPKDYDKHSKIELIKDGYVNSNIYLHNEKILDHPMFHEIPYDFLLFSYKNDNGVVFKKILKECKIEEDLMLDVSNVKFLLTEIIVGDNAYKIDLSNDKLNYYIVNNVIDKHVVSYLLNEYEFNEKKIILDDVVEYTLKIIDDNANIYLLPPDKSIKILKDSYEIL